MIEAEPKRFPDTIPGAILLGLIFLGVWLLVAQFAPAIAVVLGVGAAQGHVLRTPEQAEEALVEHLPAFLALGAVLTIALVALLHKLRWLAPAPRSPRSFRAKAAWTAGCIVVCIGGSILLTLLLEAVGHEVTEQELIVQAAAHGGIAFVLAGGIAAPLGEELAFRRMMFSTVQRGAGRVVAYLLTIACFALVHGNPSAFPHYLWMAFCFTVAYEATGSFWGAFAVHAANNLFVLVLAPIL